MGNKIDRQIELLQDSAEKWEKIVSGKALDKGCEDCPLCLEYNIHGKQECNGCPLQEQGEEFYCFQHDGIYQEYVSYVGAFRRANDEVDMYSEETNSLLMNDQAHKEKAEEMLNILEYMIDLYHMKKVHDES
jgi:hypothetical protein